MRGVVRVTTTTGVRLAYEIDTRGTPFDGTAGSNGSETAIRDLKSKPGHEDLSLRSHKDDYLSGALEAFGTANNTDEVVGNNPKGVKGSFDSLREDLRLEGRVDTSRLSTDALSPHIPSIRHPYASILPPPAAFAYPQAVRGKQNRHSIDWTQTN